MMMTREQAVECARSFIGTPYHLRGRLKGVGVDCASLVCMYLCEIGVAAYSEEWPIYSHDWFHHTTEERYKFRLLKHAREIVQTVCRGTVDAQPGDVVLFRVAASRVFNHGAIVTRWPKGIHALEETVREVDLVQHAVMGHMPMAIFSPWGEHAGR